ncbi:DUF6265 family protein [Archangium sp.]|uniref:DUF6265 family protein n=1 Tax=Archangium sp. TaxID=1872627 RepID=UPI002D6C714F|nr:DUF6265 family protein [Archangium sp.]HYO57137.1 DUF6265 family protein [Archangium sp.]
MRFRRSTVVAIVLALLSWASALQAAEPAQTAPAPRAARLTDVAWISGHWQNTDEGALSEEVWTEPKGDSMLGMWRYVNKAGQARVFELLTITQEETGPVLRLRHFDRRLVAREEKDGAYAMPLIRHAANEAVFEGTGSEGLLRLTYRRSGLDLTVTLNKGTETQTYTFKRR